MKRFSNIIQFLFLTLAVVFIACDEQSATTDELSSAIEETSIEARVDAKNLDLNKQDIEKLKKIEELLAEYGFEYNIPEDGWLYVSLAMDLEHIELQLKEIKATKEYFEKASEINRKWYAKRSENLTAEEHEEITRQINEELKELRKSIFEHIEPIPWDLYIKEIQTYVDPDIDIDQFKKDYREHVLNAENH